MIDKLYLGSKGYTVFLKPRVAKFVRFLKGPYRDEYAMLHIDPPIIGQEFGYGGKDIEYIIVAVRYQGDSLRNITKWPITVDVFIPNSLDKDPLQYQSLSFDEWTHVAETDLARTKEELDI